MSDKRFNLERPLFWTFTIGCGALLIVAGIQLFLTWFPNLIDWAIEGGFEFSQRTGLLEIIGWVFALILAVSGLVLAWQRTDALKASVEETRKSYNLTRQSIEATKQQIEIAAKDSKRDAETETRKQFREACTILDASNVSLSHFAIQEVGRLVKTNGQWFASPAVAVLKNFAETTQLDQGLLISTVDVLAEITIENSSFLPNQKFSLVGLKFKSAITNKNYQRLEFDKCTFLGPFVECDLSLTTFTDCRFEYPQNQFCDCNLTAANMVFGAERVVAEVAVRIVHCNITNIAVSVLRSRGTGPFEVHVETSKVTHAFLTGNAKAIFKNSWYYKTTPELPNDIEHQIDIFEASALTSRIQRPHVGPIYDAPN